MNTRATASQGRGAPASLTLSALDARLHGFEVQLKQVEEQLTRAEYSERTRERINEIVTEALAPPMTGVEAELLQLSEKLEAFDTTSIKEEVRALKEEFAELRQAAQVEFSVLWKHISKLEKLQDEKPGPLADKQRHASGRRGDHAAELSSGERSSRKKKSSSRPLSGRKKYVTRSESDSDSDSPLSSDAESVIDDVEVADESCRKVMQVETYRLIDRNPTRNPRLRVAKVLAELRHLFDGEMFDGSDPLSLLHFLTDLKQTFDDAALAEGDAKHMVRYFLTGEAAKLFKGLSPNERVSYRRILQWLLRTYIREGMIQDAREKFLTRAQNPSETELEYSKVLSRLAHRCGGIVSESDLANRFVRGLQPAIRTHVQTKLRGTRSWAVAVATASEYGDAHREENAAQNKPKTARFVTVPRRSMTGQTGRALLTHPTPVKTERDDESVAELDELEDLQDCNDSVDPVGAIHWGASQLGRSPSFGSYASSGGSSDTVYRTPTLRFSPGRQATPPRSSERQVMLPPGVPFPAGSRPKGPAKPCLGCGKSGHWIATCPTTNPQVKDMVLEALRARKAARQQARAPDRSQPPREQREVALLTPDQEAELDPEPSGDSQPERTG